MLDISSINPYIRIAFHSVLPEGSEIKRRIIFDYELIYIEKGSFVLNYNETDYKCKTGDFILIRPGIPHSFSQINENLSQPHIHFDMTHIKNSVLVPISFKDEDTLTAEEKSWIREDVFSDYPKTPFVVFSDKSLALKLFFKTIDMSDISPLFSKAKLLQLIEMLISDNFANVFTPEAHNYSAEKQIKDYIDASQGLNARLSDFAKQFNYSECYLDHRFKKRYGVGIITYRNRKRMQTAKEMLSNSSVTEVSQKLGFSSIYVFRRAYKNHYGSSPASVKKRIK